jgi:predicted PurR-regulated permease PerM
VTHRTPIGPRLSIALVLFAHTLLAGLFVFWTITSGAPEVENLAERLPVAVGELRARLATTGWGSALLDGIPGAVEELPTGTEAVSQVTGIMSDFVWVLASTAVLVFVGIYVAVDPGSYRRGFLLLVPAPRREAIAAVLDEVIHTLRMWVLGRIVAAAAIGIGVWIGLSILDVPLALLLGLLSGALTFIPNIGPIVSVIPPALLALVDDPIKVLWVIGLYIGLQLIESYLLTPLVEKRAVKVPPALLIAAQIILGVLTGLIGVAFAAPLVAVGMVVVRRLYVERILEPSEPSPNHGSQPERRAISTQNALAMRILPAETEPR